MSKDPLSNAPAGGLSRRSGILLALAYLGLLLAQGSVAPLQEPDEGRAASIAWEMQSSGDWITPHLNGIRYYEKPPLYFWSVAAVLAVTGTGELQVRIPSILASFLTVLLVAHWGRRIRGPREGLLSATILASMILFSLLARVAMVDPLLTLAITASLYCGDRCLFDPEPADPRPWKWRLGFWGALALAALVKGPVGVVLPLASVAAFVLAMKDWRGLRSLLHPGGILLFLAIAAPWYAAMSGRNSGYLTEFLLGQNLDRLVEGSRFNRDKPFWFYAPVLLIGLLPWSFFLPRRAAELREAWRDRAVPASRRPLYLAFAVAVPFLILTLAHSKLHHYVLPLCPPFALLLAGTLNRNWEGGPGNYGAVHFRIYGAVLLVLAIAAFVLASMHPDNIARWLGFEPGSQGHDVDLARVRRFQSPLLGAAAILSGLGVSAFAAADLLRRGRALTAVLLLAGAMLAGVFGVQFLIEPMGPAISARALALKTARHLGDGTPVVLYRRHLRGMTYYLKRPVVLWDTLYNEFGHEVGPEESGSLSLGGRADSLLQLLRLHPDTVVVVESTQKALELQASMSLTFDELDREAEFLILRARR